MQKLQKTQAIERKNAGIILKLVILLERMEEYPKVQEIRGYVDQYTD